MSGSWFQVFCMVDGSHFAMLLTEQHFWSVDQLHQNHSRFAFVCLWIRILSLFKLPVSWSEARKQETKVEREIPCHGSTEGILNHPDFLGQWPWNIIYQVKYIFYKMLRSSWLYLKDSYHHVVRKNPDPDCGDGLRSLRKLWKSSLVPNCYFDRWLSCEVSSRGVKDSPTVFPGCLLRVQSGRVSNLSPRVIYKKGCWRNCLYDPLPTLRRADLQTLWNTNSHFIALSSFCIFKFSQIRLG